jgi:hypothetical protein
VLDGLLEDLRSGRGRPLVVRGDAADDTARPDDADHPLVGGQSPDGLDDDVGAVAASQVAHSGDALLAAGGDDVGGSVG